LGVSVGGEAGRRKRGPVGARVAVCGDAAVQVGWRRVGLLAIWSGFIVAMSSVWEVVLLAWLVCGVFLNELSFRVSADAYSQSSALVVDFSLLSSVHNV